MDMHYYLKDKGIKNNKFFLAIYDTDLIGVDPYDPNLTQIQKIKVLKECINNYWYFLREVVRVPVEGAKGRGKRYQLHRGNLAMNFLFIMNYNVYAEMPRQFGKTLAALYWYLWNFNFKTSNSEIMFIHKKHEGSKDNLAHLKKYRSNLPSYLVMDKAYTRDGKQIKVPNTVETLEHPTNRNKIRTMASARNKALANGLGRGAHMALQYYDEFGFIPFNKIIYGAATPAFSKASANAKENGAPYGILITTTPGDLTTDEGLFAYEMRNNATEWNEAYYDYPFEKLEELRMSNTNSSFFHVRYTYLQLGRGEDYLREMVIDLNRDWPTIRREILLEWAKTATNCPFSQEDLDIIEAYCRKEPIQTLFFGRAGQYQLKVWEDFDTRFPPIIGVDVAGGYQQDSSAITCLDSKTTRVFATLNCNYISTDDLADVIYQLVTQYMKNAIINIERNGGFGSSVLGRLIKTSIKKNLYFEIKDKVLEERSDGVKTIRKTQKVKVYGLDSTHDVRNRLIELLHERVHYHKDKFVAPIIHDEMSTMEVKKNGKTEHASNAHDDQVFSYLMAIYVWYDGINVTQNFGLMKQILKTDEDIEEAYQSLEDKYGEKIDIELPTETIDEIDEELEYLNQSNRMTQEEFAKKQMEIDKKAYEKLLQDPRTRGAVIKAHHLDPEEIELKYNNGVTDISDEINDMFYLDDQERQAAIVAQLSGNLFNAFNNIKNIR